MRLRLAHCRAFVRTVRQGINHSRSEALPLERAAVAQTARCAIHLGNSAVLAGRVLFRRTERETLYVTESSVVIARFPSRQTHRYGLHAGVTKSAAPPSNLGSDSHLDFWRTTPGQLPMNTVFYEKETLPRVQKNCSSRLIAIASAAAKRHAESCTVRGLL
jgi:hypothetical protein